MNTLEDTLINCHLIWVYTTSLILIFLLNDVYIVSLRTLLYLIVTIAFQHAVDIYAFLLCLASLIYGIHALRLANTVGEKLVFQHIGLFGNGNHGILKLVLVVIYYIILLLSDQIVYFTGFPVGAFMSCTIILTFYLIYMLFLEKRVAHSIFLLMFLAVHVSLLIPVIHSGWFTAFIIASQLFVLFALYVLLPRILEN